MSLLSDLAISCAPFGLFPTGSPTPEKRFVLTSWIHQSTCRRRSSEHPPERRFFFQPGTSTMIQSSLSQQDLLFFVTLCPFSP